MHSVTASKPKPNVKGADKPIASDYQNLYLTLKAEYDGYRKAIQDVFRQGSE